MDQSPSGQVPEEDPHLVAKTLIKLNPDWQVWYRHPFNSHYWFKTNNPRWEPRAEYLVLPPSEPRPGWRRHEP